VFEQKERAEDFFRLSLCVLKGKGGKVHGAFSTVSFKLSAGIWAHLPGGQAQLTRVGAHLIGYGSY